MIEVIRSFVTRHGTPATGVKFGERVKQCDLLKRAFHVLLHRLETEALAHSEPAALIWACFDEGGGVLAKLRAEIGALTEKTVRNGAVLTLATIQTEDGLETDPNTILNELESSIRNTVLILSHTFGWFDSSGESILTNRAAIAALNKLSLGHALHVHRPGYKRLAAATRDEL